MPVVALPLLSLFIDIKSAALFALHVERHAKAA
jgi:hypothetical protein